MKQKIIGTGLSGMVGSRIVELLGDQFDFEDISRKTGTDISDKNAVLKRLENSDAKYVLHLAAYTNVDEAEKEKGLKEQSSAWKVNVEGTRNVMQAAAVTGKHIIHFSTDMVFPGDKPLPEKYVETDLRGPLGWYATTKFEAEKVVESAQIPWTILRIAYPYRAQYEKKEYVRIFLTLLQEGKSITAVGDHFFTPTFIDDVAFIVQTIFLQNLTGVFHITGDETVSPYFAAKKIAEVFALDSSLVSQTTRAEFFKDRAPRAFNLSLSSGRIKSLGITLHSFEEGLREIKKQIGQ